MKNTRTITDPITLEVIQNRIDSIVREMANITLRTARSAVVHSGRDFSCAIFDDKGQLMTIGTSIPVHILPMVVQMKDMLKLYEGDISPGDIFGGNDPHDGGVHLNDVQICIPMFHGDRLVGFAANRAHWTDVGGSVPGSISGKATEIFQEGLRIPSMRLGRGGRPDPDMLRFIGRNVRLPREAIGDLMSQLASCRVAEQRVADLVEGYGVDVFQATLAEILNAGERRMRARIAALPDCTVSHEGYLDNDGTFEDRVKIRSEITIRGDELTVDFTGTAPQSPGCLNVGRGVAQGFAFMGVKAALDPQSTVNAGCFRPIKVIAPEGSCLNANAPAACGGVGELGQASIITMVALSGLVPGQVSAEESSSINHQNFAGIDTRPGRGRFIFYDAVSMGCGARANKDGLDFVRTIRSGNYTMMSAEALENIFPIVFERQQLLTDSGGPGRFRGGMGLERHYRVLSDGAISVLGDNALVPPAGLLGGHRGGPTLWQIGQPEGIVPLTPKFHSKGAHDLRAGDVVRLCTPGGGGWGEPLEREPERVLNDVADGKVSLRQAQEAYGVVIDPVTHQVEEQATRQLRQALLAQRKSTVIERGGAMALEGGMRCGRAGAGTPWPAGSVVEIFLDERPQPLTVRVVAGDDVAPGRLRIDAEAWGDLGLQYATADAIVRPVHRADE